jgi:hypothetical protein
MTAPRQPISQSGGERRMQQRPALKGVRGCTGRIATTSGTWRLCRLSKGHEGGCE